jgi:hypothetical protein
MKVSQPAIDPNLALIGRIEPHQDIHQGRFAGAVFAQQGVDFALHNRQIDSGIGDHARESLDDSRHLDCQWARGGLSCRLGLFHAIASPHNRAIGNGTVNNALD